jgi:hypothetical protein
MEEVAAHGYRIVCLTEVPCEAEFCEAVEKNILASPGTKDEPGMPDWPSRSSYPEQSS